MPGHPTRARTRARPACPLRPTDTQPACWSHLSQRIREVPLPASRPNRQACPHARLAAGWAFLDAHPLVAEAAGCASAAAVHAAITAAAAGIYLALALTLSLPSTLSWSSIARTPSARFPIALQVPQVPFALCQFPQVPFRLWTPSPPLSLTSHPTHHLCQRHTPHPVFFDKKPPAYAPTRVASLPVHSPH